MLFSAKGRDFCLVCDCALHATDWSLTTELPPLQKRQTDTDLDCSQPWTAQCQDVCPGSAGQHTNIALHGIIKDEKELQVH